MDWSTVTFGNVLTIIIILVGLAGQAVLFAYVFGKHKGTIETEIKQLSSSVTMALTQCQKCGIPIRVDKMEIVQGQRNEQMAALNVWMESVDRRLENIEKQVNARER